MDTETGSSQAEFLIMAAASIPSTNRTFQLLQSYYLSRSRQIDSRNKQPNPAFSNEEMCIKCSTPWRQANFSVSVGPVEQSKKRSQKIHRLIELRNTAKQFYLKRQIKSCNNSVIVRCNLCGNKSKSILWKKTVATGEKQSKPTTLQQQEMVLETANDSTQEQSTKKKKKKKDKTAGLKFTMIKPANQKQPKITDDSQQDLQSQTQQMHNLNLQESKADEPISESSWSKSNAGHQKLNLGVPKPNGDPLKLDALHHKPSGSVQKKASVNLQNLQKANINLPQPKKIVQKPVNKNQQKKPAQSSAKLSHSKNTKNAIPPKNAQQTAKMKKNSLMHLANALKSKSSQSNTNSTQERLQKMFK